MRIYKFNGSFFLLLIITSTAILTAAGIFAKIFPLFSAKTLYFCQQFISNNLFQIPHTIPSIFLLTFVIALVLGGLSFFIAVWRTKQLVKRLFKSCIPIPKRIENIAGSLGLAKKIYLIKDNSAYSFCTGILSSKILITTSLISSLNDKELEAVFMHEKAHMINRDPFKLLFGKTVSWLFFFLPIFSEIGKNMEATSEILADLFVTRNQQEDAYLRSALKKILLTPQVALSPLPAIANPDYLEIRISRLVNPKVKHSFSLSWKSIITSVLFFIVSIFILQAPVSAFSIENHTGSSYFMCSGNNACLEKCHSNAQVSAVAKPEELFSSPKGENNFSSQTPQDKKPLYR